jgi:hypothetical protein
VFAKGNQEDKYIAIAQQVPSFILSAMEGNIKNQHLKKQLAHGDNLFIKDKKINDLFKKNFDL